MRKKIDRRLNSATINRIAIVWLVFFCLSFKIGPWDIKSPSHKNLAHSMKVSLDRGESSLFDEDQNEYWQNKLLTEAVINIVKNYYVDPDKTHPLALLSATKSGLLGQLNVDISDNPQKYLLDISGHRFSLDRNKAQSYQGLADEMTSLVQWMRDLKLDLRNLSYDAIDNSEFLILQSMLTALDAHSGLLSSESYNELKQGTEGKFGGLGLLVGLRDDLLTVIKPLPNSPAQRGGILSQDRILSINGHETFGYSLSDLVGIMKGDPGTAVELSVLRNKNPAPTKMTLKREVITVESVKSKVYDMPFGKILYASIDSFSARTNLELIDAIENYRNTYKTPVKALILDLRSNPGGLLEQAIKVSDIFIKSGPIVTTRGRKTEVESAKGGYIDFRCPIALLIDSDSASASEIVAGALQDHDRVVTIGEQSYGKGSVQTIFELPKNQALKLTIARYYTPNDRSIQNVGIMPDVWLHPVYAANTNRNILGNYRYKNERFLPHTLKEETLNSELGLHTSPKFSGYYYADPTQGEDREDVNLEMAKLIFSAVYQKHSFPLSDEVNKGEVWLDIASDAIASKINRQNREVENYLAQKHKLDWHSTDSRAKDLSFNIIGEKYLTLHPGQDVSIPFEIENKNPETAERLSIFATSDRGEFPTIEKILGNVAKDSILRDKLEIHIPSEWSKGPLKIQIGLAHNGMPMADHFIQLKTRIEERAMATVNVSSKLIDESGGVVSGKLEPKETANIQITIKNISHVAAHELAVHMVNLSGTQINLSSKNELIKDLNPNQSLTVDFPISGSKMLFNDNLNVGVLIDSNDLKTAYKKSIQIQAIPNKDMR